LSDLLPSRLAKKAGTGTGTGKPRSEDLTLLTPFVELKTTFLLRMFETDTQDVSKLQISDDEHD
jgi:hypothetical protein